MIFHVFNNTVGHYALLSPRINNESKKGKHFFIILMTEGGHSENRVRSAFAKNHMDNYYITKKRSWLYNPFITILALLQGRRLSGTEQDLFHFLKGVRKSPIIFHGVYYSFWALPLYCGYFANVSWVCWNWKTPTKHPLWTLRGIHYHIRRFAIHCHHNIVCLMAPDSKAVMNYAGMNESKVTTIPYPGTNFATGNVNYEHGGASRILLGNNAYLLSMYPKILDILGEAGVPVDVCIMVPYGTNDKAVSDFKKNFSPAENIRISYWDDMVSTDEYMERLATFDYYVCPAVQQSGLGAIYRTMSLGVTCFLDGANYEWIKSIGGIVFHISELKDKLRQRSFLNEQDRAQNREAVWRTVHSMPLWDEFFVKISADREGR